MNNRLNSDVDELKRQMTLKEKELALSKRETDGLREDNERIHRMYQLMSKEAFPAKELDYA